MNDFLILGTVIFSIVLFGTAAVLALGWAVKDGQFEHFDRGARSIFDPAEPIGLTTDAFPGEPAVRPSELTAPGETVDEGGPGLRDHHQGRRTFPDNLWNGKGH